MNDERFKVRTLELLERIAVALEALAAPDAARGDSGGTNPPPPPPGGG